MYIIVETKDGKVRKFPDSSEFIKYKLSNNGGPSFLTVETKGQEHTVMFRHEELKTVSIFLEK